MKWRHTDGLGERVPLSRHDLMVSLTQTSKHHTDTREYIIDFAGDLPVRTVGRILRSYKTQTARDKLSTSFSHYIKYSQPFIFHMNLIHMGQRGNMQDAINSNVVNGKYFSEKEILRVFKGTCEAVCAMHDYHTTSSAHAQPQTSSTGRPAESSSRTQTSSEHHYDDEEGDELLPHPEGDGESGYSYKSSVNVPLVTKHRVQEGEIIFDGDEELPTNSSSDGGQAGKGQHLPFAHRDIKPG